jgi:hypothetical protein
MSVNALHSKGLYRFPTSVDGELSRLQRRSTNPKGGISRHGSGCKPSIVPRREIATGAFTPMFQEKQTASTSLL